ncbi:Hypothetical protein GbCGDNIH3_0046 [Granulibacter bethesdensis]|uniref:L,D-TPase catalytic domain-containing protein n=2 Tax=Granulibacter bethesdensis TaxID=364410 RepID=A0AAN0VEN0_9PROT|nr:Hypothetical protein GbCGDNIH3_0046 [Granulibacter bethesdensis]
MADAQTSFPRRCLRIESLNRFAASSFIRMRSMVRFSVRSLSISGEGRVCILSGAAFRRGMVMCAALLRIFSVMDAQGAETLTAAAAPVPSLQTTPSEIQTIPLIPSLPSLGKPEAMAEAILLRHAMQREVPRTSLSITPEEKSRWIALTASAIKQAGIVLDREQLLIVVDRAPRMQYLLPVLADGGDPAGWMILGKAHVSTGQPGRKDHYLTPIGVFPHSTGILDYRAQGTYNENHIRGLGVKGMRVWDFGWQNARKGWRADGEKGDIRLLMHATDPAVLESRIGRQASQGCVRLPAALNLFLDRHGLLDADYEQTAAYDISFRALLRPDRTPTPIAGKYMVVIDSSGAPL